MIATDDVDALVALGADCVVYTSQAESRPHEALAEITAFLAAGTNVVGTSLVWLVYPPHADAWMRDPIEAACLAAATDDVRQRHRPRLLRRHAAVRRAQPHRHGPSRSSCRRSATTAPTTTPISPARVSASARRPTSTPMLFLPGVITSIWGGPIRLLADELGVDLDEIRERHDDVGGHRTHRLHDDAGRTRQSRRGSIRGRGHGRRRAPIVMEHVNRLTDCRRARLARPARRPTRACTASWSRGNPGVEINTHVGLDGRDHNEAGVIATAAKAINAIARCAQPIPVWCRSATCRSPRSPACSAERGQASPMSGPRPWTGRPAASHSA